MVRRGLFLSLSSSSPRFLLCATTPFCQHLPLCTDIISSSSIFYAGHGQALGVLGGCGVVRGTVRWQMRWQVRLLSFYISSSHFSIFSPDTVL